MSTRKKLSFGFFLLLVLAVLFVGARPQKGGAAGHSAACPDAPPYGVRGQHRIGKRDLVTEGERPLKMILWYPASPDDDSEAATTYPYKIKIGAPLGEVTIATAAGWVASDARYDLATGPYPLVILSPGFAVGGTSHSWLAEHLASYGFVVISPEHQETLDPQHELWQATIKHPQDILTVFAYVDEQVKSGDTLDD